MATDQDADGAAVHILHLEDNAVMRELVGPFGANLKLVGSELDVGLTQRGSEIRIDGTGRSGDPALALRLVRSLCSLVLHGVSLHTSDVAAAIRLQRQDPDLDVAQFFADSVVIGAGQRTIRPRTLGQRTYVDALRKKPIVFGVGPAGTGKTFLAVAMAVQSFLKGHVKRIVLSRPAVEAGEKLGFLPGDLAEKVDPYVRPLFDALHIMLTPERVARMIENRSIEVAPLAFMRGRTLEDAYVILDEAQNTTVEQMKMFLTRMGERSFMVVTGDDTQIDLPRGTRSGLVHALAILAEVSHVRVVRLGAEDIVRHPAVAAIVAAYEADAKRDSRDGRDGWRPR